MATVLHTPSFVSTILQVFFRSCACHVFHPDTASALTKVCTYLGYSALARMPQLATNYFGIVCRPWIIADCTPHTTVLYLHPTFSWVGAANKTNRGSTTSKWKGGPSSCKKKKINSTPFWEIVKVSTVGDRIVLCGFYHYSVSNFICQEKSNLHFRVKISQKF